MHRNRFFGLFGFVPQPLFNSPDDGSGGGADDFGGGDGGGGGPVEHPDFEIPGGVGGSDDGQGDDDQRRGEGEPPARGAQNGGTPPRGQNQPAGQPPDGFIPKYRLDDVIRQNQTLQDQLRSMNDADRKLKMQLAAAFGITDPNNPQPRALSDKEKAIQARIFELIPGLDKLLPLAAKAGELNTVLERVPEFSRQNDAYWQRLAKSTMTSVENAIAPALLGEGKTAKDLSPGQVKRFRSDFFSWVQSDRELQSRYLSGDSGLVADYVKELEETVLAPMRRQNGARAIAGDRRRQNLPIGGSNGTPTSGGSQTPKPLDEDAAASLAWKRAQEAIAAAAQ